MSPTTLDVTDQLMTGSDYLASLDDGRDAYLGERVNDIAHHLAFRNAARSMARLYDALTDPAQRDALTVVDRGADIQAGASVGRVVGTE